jgi:DNA-binding response OmpR family regulator
MARILIVEDEPDIALGLQLDLQDEGHDVAVCADGDLASRRVQEPGWDLILLDVMLPHRDGFEVCRDLRRARLRTPVLMLTARANEAEKVMGLEMGADDYVTKPFSPRELRARIRALLRRAAPGDEPVFRIGNCEIDFTRAEIRRAGDRLDLTAIELKLLQAFVRSPGRVLSRTQLVTAAWGDDVFVTDRVVDTHIVKIRRKLEADPANPRAIVSVRGLGYRLDAQNDTESSQSRQQDTTEGR